MLLFWSLSSQIGLCLIISDVKTINSQSLLQVTNPFSLNSVKRWKKQKKSAAVDDGLKCAYWLYQAEYHLQNNRGRNA